MSGSSPQPPLTQPGCDLTDFPFMPLDVARLRDSGLAANETPEACWAAVLLWCASWHQVPAASIPQDEHWIARTAGYGQRGKIDQAWKRVREGALRGWVTCSDGRLYHPVVASKAIEAWGAKLRQRWSTECARIKKHNERHEGSSVQRPTFEEWVSLGCPQGHPLPVPGDTGEVPSGSPDILGSKGQGEGQGEGYIYSGANAPAGADAPPAVDKSTKPEKDRQLWLDAGAWFVRNGLTAGQAKTFMHKLVKDYGREVVVEALRVAMTTEAPMDSKSLASGICRRLAGQRSAQKTVQSDQADRTAAELAARQAHVGTTPPAEIYSMAEVLRRRATGATACPSPKPQYQRGRAVAHSKEPGGDK